MIGLVIQGPIYSHGLTGRTAGKGKTRVDESRFISFNCEPSVLALLKEGISLFDEVVVSTWEGENTNFISERFGSVKIIKSQDPGTALPRFRRQLNHLPFVGEINTIRQFASTYNGLRSLDDARISYAVKIRTDQYMNLSLLKNSVMKLMTSGQSYLTPYFNHKVPHAIPDFYLAGRLNDFCKLCELMISKTFILHPNVHRDLAIKSLVLQKNLLAHIPFIDLFYTNDKPSQNLQPYLDLLPEVWKTGSRELFESLVWRGEKFTNLPDYVRFDAMDNLLSQDRLGVGNVNYKLFIVGTTGRRSSLRFLFGVWQQTISEAYASVRRFVSYLKNRNSLR